MSCPITRGTRTQTGVKNVGFNRTVALAPGFVGSDVGKSAKLISDLGGNSPTKVIAPAGDSGTYMAPKRYRDPISTFDYMIAKKYGVGLFEEQAADWTPGRDSEEAEIAIRAVYRQVFGNAYIMDSERLTIPESQFKRGALSVREFVRAIGQV